MHFSVLFSSIGFIFAIIDILKGTLVLSIPFFVFVLAGSLFHKKISKKFKLPWFHSTAITIFVFSLVFVSFAYWLPFHSAVQAADLGIKPLEMRLTLGDHLYFLLRSVYRIVLTAAILTAMLSPFALMGSFLRDWIEKKKFNKYICMYAAVFVCCLIAVALLLFLFGWVLQGIIYLLYFG